MLELENKKGVLIFFCPVARQSISIPIRTQELVVSPLPIASHFRYPRLPLLYI